MNTRRAGVTIVEKSKVGSFESPVPSKEQFFNERRTVSIRRI